MLVLLPAGWLFAGCDDEDTVIGARADSAVDGPPTADAAVKAAGDGPAADTAAPADGGPDVDASTDAPTLPFLMFTSSTDQAHSHTVKLEVASLMMRPSRGVSRDTALDAQHLHTVVLTQG